MASLHSHNLSGISTLGSTRGFLFGIQTYQSRSALLHLGKSINSGNLRVECFHSSLVFSGELCLFSSCLSSSHSFQVSGHRSTQTFLSHGTLLGESSLDSQSFPHAERHSSLVSHHERYHQGCFSKPGAQGSCHCWI